MEEKEKRTDRIIIVVLIIIILLLLLLNSCTLMKKNGDSDNNGNGNGNLTVFDFKCEKSCKKKDDDSGNNNGTNNNGSNKTNGKTNTNTNTNTNSGEEPSGTEPQTPSEEEEEETTYDMLEVYDDEYDAIKWNGAADLKIFENSYSANGTIAPESVGSYEFIVRNSTEYKLKYNLSFLETNASNINMKYKLKKNGTYLNSEYVTYSNLNLTDQMINASTKDTYVLEWKWISSDNDTDIGKNGAEYSMKIVIDAEGIDG